jgi:toxin ParE1/3/4
VKLVWSPRALGQLEHALVYIAQEDRGAAWRVYDQIVEHAQRLTEFPEMAPVGREAGTRELVVTGTPYILVYRLSRGRIEIAAVWHGKQSRKRP